MLKKLLSHLTQISPDQNQKVFIITNLSQTYFQLIVFIVSVTTIVSSFYLEGECRITRALRLVQNITFVKMYHA